LHRQMLEVLGIRDPDSIVPLEDDIEPLNPVSENMNILNETPVKAFMYQDHEAHIQTHMAMSDDPKIKELIGQSPNANAIMGAFAEHVTEHIGFQYRKEIEKQLGVPLPPPEEPLPEDIEVRLSKLVAEAAQRVLNKDLAEQRQQEIQEKMEDPVIQQRERELDIREQDVQRKMKTDAEKIATDIKKIESQEKIAGAKIGAELITDKEAITSQEKIAGAKIGKDVAETLLDIDSKKKGK